LEDPRADAVEAAGDVLVVDAGFTAGFAAHLMKRPSREHPLVEVLAADAEWVVDALVRPGAVASREMENV